MTPAAREAAASERATSSAVGRGGTRADDRHCALGHQRRQPLGAAGHVQHRGRSRELAQPTRVRRVATADQLHALGPRALASRVGDDALQLVAQLLAPATAAIASISAPSASSRTASIRARAFSRWPAIRSSSHARRTQRGRTRRSRQVRALAQAQRSQHVVVGDPLRGPRGRRSSGPPAALGGGRGR